LLVSDPEVVFGRIEGCGLRGRSQASTSLLQDPSGRGYCAVDGGEDFAPFHAEQTVVEQSLLDGEVAFSLGETIEGFQKRFEGFGE
jgi:hypothetical protein